MMYKLTRAFALQAIMRELVLSQLVLTGGRLTLQTGAVVHSPQKK